MKKIQPILTLLALVCALAALVVSLLTLGALRREGEELRTLAAENADLQQRLEQLQTQPAAPETEAACAMVVDSWVAQGDTLTLTSAFVHVQLPQGSDLGVTEARLVLTQNGRILCRRSVTLVPGEADSSFEAFVNALSLSPETAAEEGELLLAFEVTLSDGTELSADGGSWYLSHGEIYAAVG